MFIRFRFYFMAILLFVASVLFVPRPHAGADELTDSEDSVTEYASVTDSRPGFFFSINNGQVTAIQDSTFMDIVSCASDKWLHALAALFEETPDTAVEDFSTTIETLGLMARAEMESSFRQMPAQSMGQGGRMGTGAAMVRMNNVLASRGTVSSAFSSEGELARSSDLTATDSGGAWIRILGGDSNHEDRETRHGQDDGIYGLAAGVDTKLSKNILTGFFGSWTLTEIEYDDPGKSQADESTYQLGLYSAWRPGAWFFESALSSTYGSQDFDHGKASGKMKETAMSNANAVGGNLSLTMGRDSVAGAFIISSLAGVEYSVSQEYTKTGTGDLNQSASSVYKQTMRSMAGVEIQRPFKFEKKEATHILVPAIKAQWFHDFLGEDQLNDDTPGMGPVERNSPESYGNTARLGASVTIGQKGGSSGYLSYETDIMDNYVNHTLAFGVKVTY